MTKETLHLFRDEDGNVYAARDLAHAKELWTKDTGLPSEESGEWQSIPDNRILWETAYEDDVLVKTRAGQYAQSVHAPGCVGAFG